MVKKNMNKKELRKLSHETDATIWVGKEGVEKVIEELKGQLRERKAVKVKLLQSSRGEKSTEELASILAERSGAKMYETIGNTAIFVR
jgi:RNA-binding protein|tara:strand:- start:22398 stop:22661 length:264 start_codon:yes stop_codon:yes gene_type:complete